MWMSAQSKLKSHQFERILNYLAAAGKQLFSPPPLLPECVLARLNARCIPRGNHITFGRARPCFLGVATFENLERQTQECYGYHGRSNAPWIQHG